MTEYLTTEEVARWLRVHPVTVQRWCREGRLDSERVGRRYLVERESVVRFLKGTRG